MRSAKEKVSQGATGIFVGSKGKENYTTEMEAAASASESGKSAAVKRSPTDFLKQVIGKTVVVKLHSGVTYKGVLACLDGFMNIAMEQTEEYIDGQLKNKYGDCFIRGNNGEHSKFGRLVSCSSQNLFSPSTPSLCRRFALLMLTLQYSATHSSSSVHKRCQGQEVNTPREIAGRRSRSVRFSPRRVHVNIIT